MRSNFTARKEHRSFLKKKICADFSVKSTHWLVKEDHPRLTDARNGDGEATFHATAERLHAVVPDVR